MGFNQSLPLKRSDRAAMLEQEQAKLDSLLANPKPRSMTWREMVETRRKRVAALMKEPPAKLDLPPRQFQAKPAQEEQLY